MTADDRCWPEMLRVHQRLGGSRLSLIHAKYSAAQAGGALHPLEAPATV